MGAAEDRPQKLKRREVSMQASELKKRLSEDRPMTTVGVRMPADVVDDLKRMAAARGSASSGSGCR
jgi:hypothetical protein